jgi:hypothetical protein
MKNEIISQYKASLKMLKDVVNKCPDNLWDNNEHENSYWRIVYHALFYTSLYLSKSINTFTAWKNHKENYNCLGSFTYDKKPIIIDSNYSKEEMIEYLDAVYSNCESLVNNTLLNEESGFPWLPMTKGELHFYNIRHTQHHTGQLTERLHNAGIKGINWETVG